MGHKLPANPNVIIDDDAPHAEQSHEIPLDLLLVDAAMALELVQLHALSRACLISHAVLSGTPVLGESFVLDIVACMEKAKAHAHLDDEGTRVALIAAIDVVETWGLEPERRMQNAVREIVATMETIRQVATRKGVGDEAELLNTIGALAERSLGVLGFKPYTDNETIDDDEESDA